MIIIAFKKFRFLLLAFFFGLTLSAHSQILTLSGTLVDKETQSPISGVFINVKNVADPKDVIVVVTNKTGNFSVPNLKTANYLLKDSFLGYSDLVIPIESNGKSINLGILSMSVKTHSIGEVTIKGDASTAIQKGDTLEMNANAYKTTADASAEELVMKMPGISVENGAVIAHGKEVKKILVDGKDFFGEDPTVALKNLPADVVDKIQIFEVKKY